MALLDGNWVTEGGLETVLIFGYGADLAEFAAFPLIDSAEGCALLTRFYSEYVPIARATGAGLLLETPTWRANSEWGSRLGYDEAALDRINRAAVDLVQSILTTADVTGSRVSGCVGPLGDGYIAAGSDADTAAEHHLPQIRSLADAGADLVHAMTMAEAAEAIGVVRAARSVGVPVSVSFTVETDGRLPDGSTLGATIEALETDAPADFYGINCAHPTHVLRALDGGSWTEKITFFRPNASTRSHAELDAMDELDRGELPILVSAAGELRSRLPAATVIGGCCGTDSRHVAALWGTRTH